MLNTIGDDMPVLWKPHWKVELPVEGSVRITMNGSIQKSLSFSTRGAARRFAKFFGCRVIRNCRPRLVRPDRQT